MSVSHAESHKIQVHGRNWPAIRAQYESGSIGLRTLARSLGISESTMMHRARLDKWRNNRKLVKSTVAQLAATVDEQVQRKVQTDLAPWIEQEKILFTRRGVKVAKRGLTRVERLLKSNKLPEPKEEAFISKSAETYHRMGRLALGMSDGTTVGGTVNLQILTGQAAVQVVSSPTPTQP